MSDSFRRRLGALADSRQVIRCEECGSPLYPNDNPYSDRSLFCNSRSCSRDSGKPLPRSMLPAPARLPVRI